MAGKLKPLNVEAPEAAEEAEGQAKSLKPEDVLAMVIKLQKEGSLEPQIEDLISRINELQQAKKKSSEELRETHTLWEALHRELDSLNGEKVHLEEVLSKKQEALRILQMHCQEKERKAQRCWSSDWPGRSVPWRGARSSCSRRAEGGAGDIRGAGPERPRGRGRQRRGRPRGQRKPRWRPRADTGGGEERGNLVRSLIPPSAGGT
ncbi:synaptonemal complex central element protein 1-like isoform X10 [Pongo abelii]|uniref:synaptonemal complex central element protein 1-like isoform X10 n=1 Tax=Pongo abelii TaxID=9601 RepID=UPI0023E86C49|nr:synaptonemal complex central element protein 1-like isoform X11 [Pongo abelii]